MTDKDKLRPCLNAFKFGDIDFDYTVDYILKVYENSKRFNSHSFSWGLFIGVTVSMIVIALTK